MKQLILMAVEKIQVAFVLSEKESFNYLKTNKEISRFVSNQTQDTLNTNRTANRF